MERKLEISIPSEVSCTHRIEAFIEDFTMTANVSPKLFGRINLSVVEAVSNGILYGNKQDVNKLVRVLAEEINHQLIFTISDEGTGFDYTIIPDPTLEENLDKESKRGLFLMQVLSDDLRFENNGATVILVFDL